MVWNSPNFSPCNNKCYSTASLKTMYELQRTEKFYMQNFMFFLSKRSQQNFFPILCFHLHWKILSVRSLSKNTFICYRLFSSQSWHKEYHCYTNMFNSKEYYIRLLTVPHKQNPKLVFRYSLGQQSNVATTLSRALPQLYVADFEHVQTIIYT